MDAAISASREIGFTILSMTISLVAVFIPVLFMGGIVGRLLHEFSVTIVVAILISGFVSLTPHADAGQPLPQDTITAQRTACCTARWRAASTRLTRGYERTLRIALRFRARRPWRSPSLMLVGTVYLFTTMPTGFIPSQDSGFMFARHAGPAGHLVRFDGRASPRRRRDRARAPDVPGRRRLRASARIIRAFVFARMKPRDQRQPLRGPDHRAAAPEGGGRSRHLHVHAESAAHHGQRAERRRQRLPAHAAERRTWTRSMTWAPQAGGQDARSSRASWTCNTDMQIASPQVMVDIDRDRAQSLGVTPQQVQDALFSGFSQREVSVIYAPANQYSVILEVLPEYQRNPEALSKLYLRSSQRHAGAAGRGGAHARARPGRCSINHFGQLPAVTIVVQPAARLLARRSGARQVDDAIRESAHARHHQRQLPGHGEGVPEFVPEPDGPADRRDPGDLHRARASCTRASSIPITILSGLPSAVFGALLTLVIFHKQLDLYAFVGIIMLFGVVKKNAIMMIDFAIDAQRAGPQRLRCHLAAAACCASARS